MLGCRPGLASFKGPARDHPSPWSWSQAVPSLGPPGARARSGDVSVTTVWVLQVTTGKRLLSVLQAKAALTRGPASPCGLRGQVLTLRSESGHTFQAGPLPSFSMKPFTRNA